MDLSIIIVSFNTKKLLEGCISSITKTTQGISYELIVVDNASADGSTESLKTAKNTKVIKNKKNFGFAVANNQGIKVARGRHILLLNSDTIVEGGVLGEMVDWMEKNGRVGVATSALRNKDGSIQGSGGYFPNLLRVFSWMIIQDFPLVDKFIKPYHPMRSQSFAKGEGFYKNEKQLDWVTGAFFLIRREVIEQIGYLDEKYFMYVEEVDFCYRAKEKGWQVWYLPKWGIVHYGGASAQSSEFSLLAEYEGVKRFYKKFYPAWQYPILRLLLKIGSIGRIILFGALGKRKVAAVYVQAFKRA